MLSDGKIDRCDGGSVVLEFILVMPILLLLFGSTMLTFDLSMAKMRVQVGNRNIAWMTGDRYDSGAGENAKKEALEPFEQRNKLESQFSGGTVSSFWAMGGSGKDIGSIDGVASLTADAKNSKWGNLYSGNIELKMTQLSSVYLGAIALSSVLFPMDEKTHYYEAKYDLTRGEGDSNPEAILYHRMATNDNRLTDSYSIESYKICLQPFPYNNDSLVNIGIEQVWNMVAGDGASIMDLQLAVPSIKHYRVLWLLMGDLDLIDTIETVINGLSSLFNGDTFNEIKDGISSAFNELTNW